MDEIPRMKPFHEWAFENGRKTDAATFSEYATNLADYTEAAVRNMEARQEALIIDRLAELERRMAILMPDKSDDI